MGSRARSGIALRLFLALVLVAPSAWANSAIGLKGIFDALAFVIGVVALLLAAALGAMSWATALRPPSAVGWIFGRGFLAISAIVAFAVGGLALAAGLELWIRRTPEWVSFLVLVLVAAFLAIEFFIAGALYWRSSKHRPSTLAKLLSVASHALGGLFTLGTLLMAALLCFAAFVPEEQRGPTGEVRGYRDGCTRNVASDCNMLGLRYQTGDTGLPRDPEKAVRSFEKACELGATVGCRNAASMYDKGDGIPKDRDRARLWAAKSSPSP